MGDWVGVVVALGVGIPLLGMAAWVDSRRRRRVEVELAAPPARGAPTVDAIVPHYISQDTIDAMGSPGIPGSAGAASGLLAGGVRLAFGHLGDDFATVGGVAELEDAAVLMVGDGVTAMREILVPLAGASSDRPLVIVASSFHPDVLAALRANRRVTRMPVVAVRANPAELLGLQDVVGGQVLSGADLKSGWLPADAMGRAAAWRSDLRSITVVGYPGKA